MAAIDMSVVRMIFMSWVITLPAGAFLAVIFFYFFRAVLT
jgi:inorganic phosphate transporter, PiT family